MPSPRVELLNVSKEFPVGTQFTPTRALSAVSLHVNDEEIVSLVGPSGCGKSTILSLIAGFITSTEGQILVDGDRVVGIAPSRLVVFQTPALFPWLTVMENVTFGPRMRGSTRARYLPLAEQSIAAVGLNGFEGHYPYQLSGGMKQRAQIARALVNEPEVLLLDEPFGALDAQTRLAMQEMLLNVWETYRPTILFITHDVEEALFLSDRIYILSARPGTVFREIAVPFERPRQYSMLGREDFAKLKSEMLTLLHEQAPAARG